MKLNKKAYIFIFALVISFNNYAQNNQINTCTTTLDELDENYKIGRFEDVKTILENCLQSTYKSNDVSYLRALRIQAKNLIAMDSMMLAREVAKEILNLKPSYTQQSGDPYLLEEMIKSLKIKGATVSSVSKFEESLGEAPATVILVTEDEIIDRGYNDLEAYFMTYLVLILLDQLGYFTRTFIKEDIGLTIQVECYTWLTELNKMICGGTLFICPDNILLVT